MYCKPKQPPLEQPRVSRAPGDNRTSKNTAVTSTDDNNHDLTYASNFFRVQAGDTITAVFKYGSSISSDVTLTYDAALSA